MPQYHLETAVLFWGGLREE